MIRAARARVPLLLPLLGLLACDPGPAAGDAPLCGTFAFTAELAVTSISSVDVLLVVSNAPSMADEQAALARELPELVRALVTGEPEPGQREFDPVRDLHLGIVSTDLGVNGGDDRVAGCAGFGDGAALQQLTAGAGCANAPGFLSYFVPNPTVHPLIVPPSTEPIAALTRDVSCFSALGSAGCGITQPLEVALRALWPTGLTPNGAKAAPPTFVGASPQGAAANAGFLRNDPRKGFSLVSVLLISDGDDCSVRDGGLFGQAAGDPALDPRALCAQHGELLHGIERYVNGLQALRPGSENLVMFGAITGIPEDLLLPLPNSWDDAKRQAQYDAILADPRMQNVVRADGSLQPACENATASATPARRIVETARAFGADARLASICSPGWTSAILPLLEQIQLVTGGVCLGRKQVRDASGLTQCDVLWELPLPGEVGPATPTHCSERAFLSDSPPLATTREGHPVCNVRQLAVTGIPAAPELEPGEGWFYDDFSKGNVCPCAAATCNSVFFVPNLPPSGVKLTMRCHQTHVLPSAGSEPSEHDAGECRVP